MTLQTYLRIFRERWKLIVVVLVVAILAAVGITLATPTSYTATAQIFVAPNISSSDPSQQYQAEYFVQTQIATYADIIDSPDVLKKVREDLNLTLSNDQLAAKISASAPANRSLVQITAIDSSPDQAAALANSAASAFVTFIQANTTPSGASKSTVQLTLTGPATAPSTPTSPKTSLNIGLGVILGILAGIALAVARDVLDNRVKDPAQLARLAEAPLMGAVVEDPKTERHPIATRTGTRSVRAENYRQLRANLQFANVDEHPRVIAVTSSIPGEGKTTVAVNLATTLAEAGFTVCLVDADLRRPAIARTLGLVSPVGLTSVLIHQLELADAIQPAGSGLYVLASGPTPPNPSEVLASSFVRGVIRSLLDRVDYVVLDTAPLLPVSDGSEVAALADGTLLVGRWGETTDAQVKRAVQTMRRVGAPLVGVILNRVPARRGRGDYSYGYYAADDIGPGHAGSEGRRRRGTPSAVPEVAEPAESGPRAPEESLPMAPEEVTRGPSSR